jgi:hypothetical protein
MTLLEDLTSLEEVLQIEFYGAANSIDLYGAKPSGKGNSQYLFSFAGNGDLEIGFAVRCSDVTDSVQKLHKKPVAPVEHLERGP